jgi:hypothetical protein
MFKYLAVGLLFFLHPLTARATTGTEFEDSCRLALAIPDNATPKESDFTQAAHCYGIVEGVLYTLEAWEAADQVDGRKPNVEACIPEHVTVGQATRVVLKYLDAHPERLQHEAVTLSIIALREGFPCGT